MVKLLLSDLMRQLVANKWGESEAELKQFTVCFEVKNIVLAHLITSLRQVFNQYLQHHMLQANQFELLLMLHQNE